MNNGNGSDNNYAELSGILLDVVGIIINLENLRLNEDQSKGIMEELSEKQDKMLETIIAQNKILIRQNRKLEKLLKKLVK